MQRDSSKKPKAWLAVGASLVLAASAGGCVIFGPKAQAPSTDTIEATPERLARGRYLGEHVMGCLHCHSEPDATRFGMPPAEVAGNGGVILGHELGLPGTIQAPNITSDPEAGIGTWTDGEILRALREGVRRDGRALFPMMPYTSYRNLSDEDARSVVVWLRTLAPSKRKTVPVDIDFPVNIFIRFAPQPVTEPVSAPPSSDSLAYGEYLVTMAGCKGCHTEMDDKGGYIKGREYAGGRVFTLGMKDGKIDGSGPRSVSANITPHATGYFGRASKAEWIARTKAYGALVENPPPVTPGTNTMMPWLQFSGLTEEDLGAIYDYMKTVPPVENVVASFPDAAEGAAAPTAPAAAVE